MYMKKEDNNNYDYLYYKNEIKIPYYKLNIVW